MNFFDGLHLYEIVLMILGAMLFLVLVVVLIVFVARNRSITPLLLFFVIPLVMIGFPAISKAKFDKDGIEIDKATAELTEHPSSTAIKTKLESLIEQTKSRLTESPEGLVKIARAEAVLGNQDKALHTLDRALNSNPKLEIAKDLKTRLETASPSDEAAVRHAVKANIAGHR